MAERIATEFAKGIPKQILENILKDLYEELPKLFTKKFKNELPDDMIWSLTAKQPNSSD